MAADPAQQRAGYQDVLDAPRDRVAEVVDGQLILNPRLSAPHAAVSSALGEELGPPFKRGKGGPGGWILLDEPELHLAEDILVPDLAGWRRQRMQVVPSAAFISLSPDWACEIVSPRTQRHDRIHKVPIFAREGVGHVWLIDPALQTLEVLRLQGGSYLIAQLFEAKACVRAEPFDAIELDLSVLWADIETSDA